MAKNVEQSSWYRAESPDLFWEEEEVEEEEEEEYSIQPYQECQPFGVEGSKSNTSKYGVMKFGPPKVEDNKSVSPEPSPPVVSHMRLNHHKAGMQGIDKAKINKIIMEASQGSKFYENEVKKEEQLKRRIEVMLQELRRITLAQRVSAEAAVDEELAALERRRDLSRIVVHVDMDAFYASVEMRDDPRLKTVPMAVGSYSMLSTSNYLARRYGVRAAMPGFIGKKLCPNLKIVPANYQKYRQASEQVRDVLAHYDPHFSPVGLDESYLDLTAFVCGRLSDVSMGDCAPSADVSKEVFKEVGKNECGDCGEGGEEEDGGGREVVGGRGGGGGMEGVREDGEGDGRDGEEGVGAKALSQTHWVCAEKVVEEMRKEIHKRTGLTASAGLATNMMLAKVASDINKPDGQFVVPATRDSVLEFVWGLPIRKISGIGKVTESMLNALGVSMCKDLYHQRAILHLLFSSSSSSHFLRVCMGLGSTHVHREYDRKSMSTERTFAEICDPADLYNKCDQLCQDLASDMSRASIKGYTVSLKMKTVQFEVRTRALTSPYPVSSVEELRQSARHLLAAELKATVPRALRLRLMGVRISSLQRRGRGRKQETLDGFVYHSPTKSITPSTSETTLLPNDRLKDEPNYETNHKPNSTSHNRPNHRPNDPILGTNYAAKHDHTPTHGPNTEPIIRPTLNHTDTELSSSSGGGGVVCPVCGERLSETADNIAVNQHIDECLNLSAITSITTSSTYTPVERNDVVTNRGGRDGEGGHGRGGGGEGRGGGAQGGGGGRTNISLEREMGELASRKRAVELDHNEPIISVSHKKRKTLEFFWKQN